MLPIVIEKLGTYLDNNLGELSLIFIIIISKANLYLYLFFGTWKSFGDNK